MHSATSPTLARRDLLRGAAALLGGSALGLLPSLAEAAPAETLSVGYLSGGRFVDAASLRSGDANLDRVVLTVTGDGLDAIEAHAPVPGLGRVPFTLWVAPPGGTGRSRSKVATETDGGLVLGVFLEGRRHEIALRGDGGSGVKLREGTYVLTPGKAAWGTFGQEDGKVVAFRRTPHVVITVERA